MEDVVIFVAGNPDLYPLEYYDAGAESYEGVIPELLARFSEQSRYQVRYLQPGVIRADLPQDHDPAGH